MGISTVYIYISGAAGQGTQKCLCGAGCEKPQRAAPLDRTMTVARLGTDQGTDALLVKMNSVVLFKIIRWYEIHFLDLNANALHSTV
jgi:hypothetical protein